MAYTDLLPRGGALTGALRRMARAIPRLRMGAPDAPKAKDGACRISLDPRTMHDIGACPAYRDYASALTLGAGAGPGLHRLAEAARWDVLR